MKLLKILLALCAFQVAQGMNLASQSSTSVSSSCVDAKAALPKFEHHPDFNTVANSLQGIALYQTVKHITVFDLERVKHMLPQDLLFSEGMTIFINAIKELEKFKVLSNFTLTEVAKSLVLVDALLDIPKEHQGSECLVSRFMRYAASTGNIVLLEHLLKRKATINFVDSKNRTLLHHAAYESQEQCMVYLIDHGINRDARDSNGKTAFNIFMTKELVSLQTPLNMLLAVALDALE